jgi:uncharacterized membrane protein
MRQDQQQPRAVLDSTLGKIFFAILAVATIFYAVQSATTPSRNQHEFFTKSALGLALIIHIVTLLVVMLEYAFRQAPNQQPAPRHE